MKTMLAALAFATLIASAAPAVAKTRVMVPPKMYVCMIGDSMISGLNKSECDLLNAQADNRLVKGCDVRGRPVRELNEDQCDLVGDWVWIPAR